MAKKKTTKKKTASGLKSKTAKAKPTGRKAAPKGPPSRKPSKPSRKVMQKRADLGAAIGIYFDSLTGEHKRIADALRKIVEAAAPRATSAVKWGMPVFEQNGMLCYIRARPKYVTLGFYESGISLGDPEGLLEGSGDNMRHIKVPSMAAVKPEYFGRMVKEAVAFNERGSR